MKTIDKIKQGDPGRWRWVMAIEGYEKLIVSHPGEVPEALAAWSNTPWSEAIAGLDVSGMEIDQNLEPWDPSIQVPSFRVRVADQDDELARALFKFSAPRTELTQSISPTTLSRNIHGKSFEGWPVSGVAHVGNERFEYSTRTSTTLGIPENGSGTMSPFSADESQEWTFPRRHRISPPHETARPVEITQEPDVWVGKMVGIYLHLNEGGVWTSAEDAWLHFAGVLIGFEDGTDGVWLELEDMRRKVRDTTLATNQYKARIADGIELEAGERLVFGGAYAVPGDLVGPSTVTVDIVESNPGGYETEAGFYTAGELCSEFNRHFANAHWDAGDIPISMVLQVSQNEDRGTRVRWKFGNPDAIAVDAWIGASKRQYLSFLGFSTGLDGQSSYFEDVNAYLVKEGSSGDSVTVFSDYPPKKALQEWEIGAQYALKITTSDVEGEWQSIGEHLPEELRRSGQDGDDLGILRVGQEHLLLVHREDDNTFFLRWYSDKVGPIVRGSYKTRDTGIAEDEDGEIPVRQVILLEGELNELLPRLLASVDGSGVNHGDYDDLPWGAGIPWSLMPRMLDSILSAEEEHESGAMTVVLEKPTKLLDIIVPELMLRYRWLLWRKGGYQLVTMPRPSPIDPDYVLDHESKARPGGDTADNFAAPSQVTSEFVKTEIKIDYNRDLVTGDYQDRTEIIERPAGDNDDQVVTIEARNHYAGFSETPEMIDSMKAYLASRMVPTWSRPIRKLNRTVNLESWDIAPGDTVAVTDPLARNPISGERSLSNKGGVVIRVRQPVDPPIPEVEVLFADEDRRFFVGASGNVVGWIEDSGDHYIGITDEFQSSGGHDFEAGDEVVIHERNPEDPSDVQQWQRTILSVSDSGDPDTHTLAQISDGLFGFDPDKLYRVVPAEYDEVQDSQRLQSFQADELTGLIDAQARPNAYMDQDKRGFSVVDATRPYEKLPESYAGDGKPVSTAMLDVCMATVNNLLSYKLSANAPYMQPAVTVGDFDLASVTYPVFVGMGKTSPMRRFVRVAPLMSFSGELGEAECRVIISKRPPAQRTALAQQGFALGEVQSALFTTDSSSPVALDPQDIPLVYDESIGVAWVTYRMENTAAQILGLVECRVGELIYTFGGVSV